MWFWKGWKHQKKVKAIIGEDSEDLEDLVNMYMNCYINGIEILNMLREDFPDVYEDIVQLEQTYRKEVELRQWWIQIRK